MYKPGTQNTNADALSRINVTNITQEQENSNAYQTYLEEKTKRIISNKNIIEIAGNIFEAPEEYVLGHCTSQDFQMNQGIALEFRRKFCHIEELKNQKKSLTEIVSEEP